MDSDPNTLLRKKYFVDANAVFLKKKPEARRRAVKKCNIIRSSKAKVSEKSFRLPLLRHMQDTDHGIDVKIIKDGEKIKSIIIVCPCGRSTELNCEYASEKT